MPLEGSRESVRRPRRSPFATAEQVSRGSEYLASSTRCADVRLKNPYKIPTTQWESIPGRAWVLRESAAQSYSGRLESGQ